MENLKDRLFQLRRSLNLSQEDMALLIGKSTPAWQSYERGISFPGGEVFRELNKLGFNLNWLVSGRGDMRVDSSSDIGSNYSEQISVSDKFEIALNEIEVKVLMEINAIIFWELFEEFRKLNPAQMGWCQMELIMRFPEFRGWLRKEYGGIDYKNKKADKKALQEYIDRKESLLNEQINQNKRGKE